MPIYYRIWRISWSVWKNIFIENPITDSCQYTAEQLKFCKDLSRKIASGECDDEESDVNLLFDTIKDQIRGWWN